MTTAMHAILGELFKSQFLATIDEMGRVVSRNAVSPEITQGGDFANGLLLERGEVVAIDNLLHIGPMSETAAAMQDAFKFALKPGDVILGNDPYSGGNHVQDFTVMTPFYHGRDHLCYLAVRAHMPDIGGQVPGGYFPFADDVWAEGSRITPVRVVKEGRVVGDALDAILMNSRYPDVFRVNLDALLAALEVGGRKLHQAVEKYGKTSFREAVAYCLRHEEALLRAEIGRWPRGEFEGQSALDHDARGTTNVEVKVRLTVDSDRVVLDFSGSARQSPGFVNSTLANTVSCALIPLYVLLEGKVPAGSGLLRCVEIVTAPGTVVHSAFPAPVGWGAAHVGAEITAAVTRALAAMFPDRLASLAPKAMMAVAQWPGQQQAFPLDLFLLGGAGATAGCDGWGSPGPFARGVMPSVEMVESHAPLRVRRLEMLPDSAGEGRWRGGHGTVVEFEFHEQTLLNAIVEGRTFPSEGVAGGEDGGSNSLRLDGRDVDTGIVWQEDVSGRIVEIGSGGGGGWGPPSERSTEALVRDLEDELLSLEKARLSNAGRLQPAAPAMTEKVRP